MDFIITMAMISGWNIPAGSGVTLQPAGDRRRTVRAPDPAVPARPGRTPAGVSATATALQDDPHFRDHVLFYEYFHGDTGQGLGASHQTGWTGLVALLLHGREADDPTRMDMPTG